MEPTVKLRLGNLFDGPSDLIVLPCSTAGTITGPVVRSLLKYSIPHPQEGMEFGAVEILPFDGADDIAQYVAFAASVKGYSSTPKAIEAIGRAVGEFTASNPAVRNVAAPLLGAGAGGLQSEVVAAALRTGFAATAATDATMIIHVLHREVYDRLKGNRRVIQGKPKQSVRVFISHTSKTTDDVEWVKSLALHLIDQGIQARLDKFHLRHGMDLPQWMCNELALASKVIIVCDEAYKQKADGRLGGVGWETMIIQGDLSGLPPDSTKYQVVVRAADMESGLPLYLKTRYAFHAPDASADQVFRSEIVKELLDITIDPALEAREFAL